MCWNPLLDGGIIKQRTGAAHKAGADNSARKRREWGEQVYLEVICYTSSWLGVVGEGVFFVGLFQGKM